MCNYTVCNYGTQTQWGTCELIINHVYGVYTADYAIRLYEKRLQY